MDPWSIRPSHGLGGIEFACAPDAVMKIDDRYGRIETDDIIDPFAGDELFDHLVSTLGEQEARAAMAVIAEAGIDTRPHRLTIYETGVSLSFVEGKLEEIMLDQRATQAQYEGYRFFNTDPLPALRALQIANGSPPVVKRSDCYFANIFLTAFACIAIQEDGRICSANEATDEAQQTTIAWRKTPRNQLEDLSGHMSVEL